MSREKKFTPGPWLKDYGNTGGHIKAIINDGKRCTPTVAKYYISAIESTYEQEANAHLIAAAPELLEALEGMLVWFQMNTTWNEEDGKRFIKAEDAVKKAYGEEK